MDTRVVKAFLIFCVVFIVFVVGLVIYDNATKIEILKNDHLSDVTYDEDKKNIYIFWGNGCAHCEDLRVYLEDNTNLWKNDYQIFSFETWKDAENDKLMDDVMAFLERKNEGTPTVLIGDEVMVGFSTNSIDELNRILEEQKDSEYDVMKAFQEQ